MLSCTDLARLKAIFGTKPAPKYMPTDEDMRSLLVAVKEYWDVSKNPDVRFEHAVRRAYHRDRNYAVILGLLDIACRIAEMISFKLDDYDKAARQVTVRKSKGGSHG